MVCSAIELLLLKNAWMKSWNKREKNGIEKLKAQSEFRTKQEATIMKIKLYWDKLKNAHHKYIRKKKRSLEISKYKWHLWNEMELLVALFSLFVWLSVVFIQFHRIFFIMSHSQHVVNYSQFSLKHFNGVRDRARKLVVWLIKKNNQ